MCTPRTPPPPPPPPAPPPVLDQAAPKSKGDNIAKNKSKGLSRYKVQTSPAKTNKLGGIPKKVGIV